MLVVAGIVHEDDVSFDRETNSTRFYPIIHKILERFHPLLELGICWGVIRLLLIEFVHDAVPEREHV